MFTQVTVLDSFLTQLVKVHMMPGPRVVYLTTPSLQFDASMLVRKALLPQLVMVQKWASQSQEAIWSATSAQSHLTIYQTSRHNQRTESYPGKARLSQIECL